MSASESTEVKAVCHCGQLSVMVEVLNSDLPLPLWLCGCDTCRYSTGMLAITCAFLPKGDKKITVSGEAKRYQTSDGPGALIRCFCGTCGASVYEDSPDPDRVSLYAGALTKTEGVVEIAGMTFAGDAKDGGMAEWLRGMKIYEQNFAPRNDYTPKPAPPSHPYGEHLHCRCHCKGVEFWITRPSPESHAVDTFVHPDFVSGTKADETDRVIWWIRGQGKKYAAVLCMCNDCRRATGYDIQPWAFIPAPNMIQKDGSPASLKMGTLKHYKSSKKVDRYFCDTCSAQVFFVEQSRPHLLDVSVGLFDAESGARAEEWLEWSAIVSYNELAQNRPLCEALCRGMDEWNQRTGKGAVKT